MRDRYSMWIVDACIYVCLRRLDACSGGTYVAVDGEHVEVIFVVAFGFSGVNGVSCDRG